MRYLQKFRSPVLLLACAIVFAPQLLRAQDSGDDDDSNDAPTKPFVNLGISIAPDDSAKITLSTFFATGSGKDVIPDVEALLGCKLREDRSSQVRRISVLYGSCQLSPGKSGLLRTKTISLTRLVEATKSHGAEFLGLQIYLPDTEASETLPPAPMPPFDTGRLARLSRKEIVLTATYNWKDLNAVPPAIRIQYGYRQATLARMLAILAGFLLLPLILVSWLGRRALSAPQEHAASVWFSYMRYLGWTLNFSLLGWFATVESLDCRELLQFVLSSVKYRWLPSVSYEALMWCTPVVIWVSCLVLSKSVQEKLRGVSWTRRELTLQALFSFCGAFIPLAMWIGAFVSVTSSAYRAAVFLFVGGLIIKLFAKSKLAKLLGMQPHALTSGDLRDVAFAIAQRLGVKLQQIYLIPSGKGRMANAFARTGNTIAFTDFLLNQMTKREVNFVIAHELTHLQKRHPNKIASITGGVAMGCGMLIGVFRPFLNLNVSPYVSYGAIILLSMIVTYAFTRQFEYEADAGAVAATSDPQAAICALFKLAQLNLHPLQWSNWSEKWLTHPSMMRRAKAIAARARIPEVSIPDMAARGVEPRLHYAIPDDSQRKGKILSTIRRGQSLRQLALLLLGIAILPPAICAFAAQTFSALEPYRHVLYGAGFVIAMGLHLFVSGLIPKWTLRPVVEKVKQKLESEKAVQTEAWAGIPVGLAPADRPRVYEGLAHWDLGFLFLRSDRVCYVGEETAFSLQYDQVTDLKLGPGNPSWLRNRRVYVAWKDDERKASGVFSITAASPESAWKIHSKTNDLYRQLNRWRNAKGMNRPLPDALAKLETPQFREVTSHAPGDSLKGRKLANEFTLTALFAGVVAMLFGLPFHLMDYVNGFLVPWQTALAGAGAGWYLVAAALSIRAFQFAPLFFQKDRPAIQAAVIPATAEQSSRPAAPPPPLRTENTSALLQKK